MDLSMFFKAVYPKIVFSGKSDGAGAETLVAHVWFISQVFVYMFQQRNSSFYKLFAKLT